MEGVAHLLLAPAVVVGWALDQAEGGVLHDPARQPAQLRLAKHLAAGLLGCNHSMVGAVVALAVTPRGTLSMAALVDQASALFLPLERPAPLPMAVTAALPGPPEAGQQAVLPAGAVAQRILAQHPALAALAASSSMSGEVRT